MRIATWNTANRVDPESPYLNEMRPDVAVLPEWGNVPMRPPAWSTSFVEFGETNKRGLGVAACGEWSVSAPELPKIEGVVVGGVQVDGPSPFRLIAVWSYLSGSPKVNPVIEALDAWAEWTSGMPLVVAGDFNTGGWWQDIREGPMSHFPIVERLESLGLHSAYHADRGTEQGADENTTHWHSRGGTFMIDHVFTPAFWAINSVTVGEQVPWRERSDHAPMVVDVVPV